MLALTVRCGQAVQIGEAAVVKVEHKSGRQVKLVFHTALAPIRLLADGLIPARFTFGLSGEPRRVLEPAGADRIALRATP